MEGILLWLVVIGAAMGGGPAMCAGTARLRLLLDHRADARTRCGATELAGALAELADVARIGEGRANDATF